MGDKQLTIELKAFINEYIESIALLDILFLFYSNPQKLWSFESLNRESRTNLSSTSKNVLKLLDNLFVEKVEDYYRFKPKNEELASQITQLFAVYSERPVTVIAFIYERPRHKLREFADAFKLKKD